MTYPIITSVDTDHIWQHWVDKAMVQLQLPLPLSLQHYLIELLNDSLDDPELVARYEQLGFSWLKSQGKDGSSEQLHRVGKDSLLMAGLFHVHVNPKRLNDCCLFGIHAYRSLADRATASTASSVYTLCADHFKPLVYVIDRINHPREHDYQ